MLNLDPNFIPVTRTLNMYPDNADEQINRDTARLLTTLSQHLPGVSGALRQGQQITNRDAAEFLDLVAQTLRAWSSAAVQAKDEHAALKADVAAFRRILGTAPVQS